MHSWHVIEGMPVSFSLKQSVFEGIDSSRSIICQVFESFSMLSCNRTIDSIRPEFSFACSSFALLVIMKPEIRFEQAIIVGVSAGLPPIQILLF